MVIERSHVNSPCFAQGQHVWGVSPGLSVPSSPWDLRRCRAAGRFSRGFFRRLFCHCPRVSAGGKVRRRRNLLSDPLGAAGPGCGRQVAAPRRGSRAGAARGGGPCGALLIKARGERWNWVVFSAWFEGLLGWSTVGCARLDLFGTADAHAAEQQGSLCWGGLRAFQPEEGCSAGAFRVFEVQITPAEMFQIPVE